MTISIIAAIIGYSFASAKDTLTSEKALARYSQALSFTRTAGIGTAKICYITAQVLLRAAWLLMLAYALLTTALIGWAERWGKDFGDTLGRALVMAVAEANADVQAEASAPVKKQREFLGETVATA